MSVRAAVTYLVGSAVDLALENHTDEAVTRLRSAFRGTNTVEGGPWLAGMLVWESSVREALVGLRAMLQRIPGGIDLHDLETDLDPEKPRRYLIQAFQGDRAFENRIYAHLYGRFGRSDQAQSSWRTLARLPFASLGLRDQAIYLELMEKEIEGAKLPYWSWKEREGRNPEPFKRDRTAPLSTMLSLLISDRIDGSAGLEAEILLARAALAAYHGGVEAGVRKASSSTDPFSGQALQSRIDPDGTLVLWSVGAGPNLEFVWRIPKR
jgi:hypothetical protein